MKNLYFTIGARKISRNVFKKGYGQLYYNYYKILYEQIYAEICKFRDKEVNRNLFFFAAKINRSQIYKIFKNPPPPLLSIYLARRR